MAKSCAICGKGQMSGHNVSFSNNRTKRVWKPNLRKVKADIDGSIKRIYVCSKCLKAGKVTRVY